MGTLTGRRALVTGGHGGLGSVAVRTLLELDAEEVIVVGRSQPRLEAFRESVGDGRVSVVPMDVTVAADWEPLRHRVIDVLIPAAGTAHRAPFIETAIPQWEAIIDTNLNGTLLAAAAVLPGMLERHWGRIILISSVAARIGLPGRAVYSASKAGLEAWARAVAAEVADTGVIVNCVAPGMFPTDLTKSWLAANPDVAESIRSVIPQRRFGNPDELAAAFRFLLEATYVQGSVVQIDGGWGSV